ncbi:helix-turn-helix transcriptional regulator [Saccharopolyspora sp. 6M]|uniref:helix-turn-helix domain-containing protein n=1 Tax=Saccharopolyspora sp. 6M TaxID=2877237 RepID=UPI001CD20BE8|nr:helix-turn-helix transcriptional regulator [Saccharopolyspora sp. 6M]MCA1226101.1 helix-turn-helix domain-containing protein [Saccharopolyspora sp. 6M]
MPDEFKANVRLRRIGRELRKWRTRAGHKNAEAAKLLKWSPAKISKIENAAQPIQGVDVIALGLVYDVPEDERNALFQATLNAKETGWWHDYGTDVLFSAAQDFIELESEATTERAFIADLVPGILQTEDYAKALSTTFLPSVDDTMTERRAAVRAKRQERLTGSAPLRTEVVIWEPALRQGVGGAATARGQIDHLLALSEQENVTIQVVPAGIGAYPSMGSSFTMLGFAEKHFSEVVYLDSLTKGFYVEDSDEVVAYIMTFEALQAAALDQKQSITLMGSIARSFSD